MAISYNTTQTDLTYLYRATSGGTVFSSNLCASTAFDLFGDSPQVNDAIYFGADVNFISDLTFNIGTSLAGSNVVLKWECNQYIASPQWVDVSCLQDDTSSFTISGSNRVRFPAQFGDAASTVNGATCNWIRCRLHSFNSISEGGANQTTRIKYSDGVILVTGYTSADPASFTTIYEWMKTNYPYVYILKNGTYFDFRWVGLNIQNDAAAFFSYNEVIEVGSAPNGNYNSGNQNQHSRFLIREFTSGYKIGNHGYGGSTFIFYAGNNTYLINTTVGNNFYGCTFKCPPDLLYSAGYPAFLGENLDCNFEITLSMINLGSFKYCKFMGAIGWISSGFPSVFENNSVIISNSCAYCYTAPVALKNINFDYMNSWAFFFFLYQTYNNVNFDIIDSKSFGNLTDDNRPVARTTEYPTTLFLTAFFYDSGTQQYYDYTSAFNDDPVSDASIGGNAGDIYYFRTPSSYNYGLILRAVTSLTSNDYMYEFEEYCQNTWQQLIEMGDLGYNFTVSNGQRYLSNMYIPTLGLSSTTINNVTGYWFRMKIVTKGTGNPKITTLYHSFQSTAMSNWAARELYTVNINVLTPEGDPMTNANVICSDSDGSTNFNLYTDASGNIAEQQLLRKKIYFDPLNGDSNQLVQKDMGLYTLNIIKDGYEAYNSKFNLSEKINWKITNMSRVNRNPMILILK